MKIHWDPPSGPCFFCDQCSMRWYLPSDAWRSERSREYGAEMARAKGWIIAEHSNLCPGHAHTTP